MVWSHEFRAISSEYIIAGGWLSRAGHLTGDIPVFSSPKLYISNDYSEPGHEYSAPQYIDATKYSAAAALNDDPQSY